MPVVCGTPSSRGQSPFGQASAIVSGCGFGIWEESETAATNNPTGTLKMCGSAMRLMLFSRFAHDSATTEKSSGCAAKTGRTDIPIY
jgi:hypothetical protein